MSFSESTGALAKSVQKRTRFHFCNHCSHGELPLTACDREQFLTVVLPAKGPYDLVDGISEYRTALKEDDDHARFVSTLCALVSKV